MPLYQYLYSAAGDRLLLDCQGWSMYRSHLNTWTAPVGQTKQVGWNPLLNVVRTRISRVVRIACCTSLLHTHRDTHTDTHRHTQTHTNTHTHTHTLGPVDITPLVVHNTAAHHIVKHLVVGGQTLGIRLECACVCMYACMHA